MAKTDHLDPARIKRALEKLKYKTSGKIGARKTRLKASGTQQLPEEIVAVNTLSLELENVEGEWRPVPPVGEDFTSAPSILHSVAKGVTTKAYIRNRADLERVLIKIGVLAAPENMPEMVKKRGGRWGRKPDTKAATPQHAVKPAAKQASKQAAKRITKTATKPGVRKPAGKVKAAKKTTNRKTTKRGAVAVKTARRPASKQAAKRSGGVAKSSSVQAGARIGRRRGTKPGRK